MKTRIQSYIIHPSTWFAREIPDASMASCSDTIFMIGLEVACATTESEPLSLLALFLHQVTREGGDGALLRVWRGMEATRE